MGRLGRIAIGLIAAGLLLAGCRSDAGNGVPAAPVSASTSASADPWAEDLELMIRTLITGHKNLYHSRTKAEYDRLADEIRLRFPSWDEHQRRAEMMRLAAYVGDAHTRLEPWKVENMIPLSFYVYPEGMLLIGAEEENADLLGQQAAAVNGKPMDEVLARLAEVIPHENGLWLDHLLPDKLFLGNGDLLYGLGITDKPEEARFTFRSEDGKETVRTIRAVTSATGQKPGIRQLGPEGERKPLNMKRSNKENWYEWDGDRGLMYVQYNVCQDGSQTVLAYGEEILELLRRNTARKVVVDLRYNSGGNSSLFMPFIEKISEMNAINRKGTLYVVIGRATFSSGLLNALSFRGKTKAVLVGEPTGGKPDSYGEVKEIRLTHTGLTLKYSTQYFHRTSDSCQPTLEPDVRAVPAFRDFLEGRDPALVYILSQSE